MNSIQFDAICKIAGIGRRSPQTRMAVLAVVMQGKTQKEASKMAGIEPHNISMACRRFNDAIKVAYEAVTGEKHNGEK